MNILKELTNYFGNENKAKHIISYYKSMNINKLFIYKKQWEIILHIYNKKGYNPYSCDNRYYCKEKCCFSDNCGNSDRMPISFSDIINENVYYAMIELCNICIANKNIIEI